VCVGASFVPWSSDGRYVGAAGVCAVSHAAPNGCQSQHHGLWMAPKRCRNYPSPPPPVQVVGTEVQAVSLSPYTPYIDVEELGSFTLSRLFPPCYTPSSLSGFKPLLAEIRWVCTGSPSIPGYIGNTPLHHRCGARSTLAPLGGASLELPTGLVSAAALRPLGRWCQPPWPWSTPGRA
jgi:hypothetical protein